MTTTTAHVDLHADGSPVAAPATATAAQVIAVALAYRDYRIAAELEDIAYGGWSDPDAGHRYVQVLRDLAFVAFDDRHVVAVAPDTFDGRVWGYVGSHILDYAAQLLHDATLSDVGDRATILRWEPQSACTDLVRPRVYLCDWCDTAATVVVGERGEYGYDFACAFHLGYWFGRHVAAGVPLRIVAAPNR